MDTESSGIDSPDNMNSSSEMILSPEEKRSLSSLVQRRKLNFLQESPEHEHDQLHDDFLQSNLIVSPKKLPSYSPPYRKVRQLR